MVWTNFFKRQKEDNISSQALGGVCGQCHALASLPLGKRLGTNCTGGRMGPRASLDCVESLAPIQPTASQNLDNTADKKKSCKVCRARGCCETCRGTCKCRHVVIRLPLFTYYTDSMH